MHGREPSSRPCEAALLTGVAVDDVESAAACGREPTDAGTESGLVRLRELGAVFASGDESGHVPAFAIEVHGTTGVGDAFCARRSRSRWHPVNTFGTRSCAVTQRGRWPSVR
jgi:hypothetical protein